MCNNPSPVEALTAFAIAFAAGALFTVGVSAYGSWMKSKGQKNT